MACKREYCVLLLNDHHLLKLYDLLLHPHCLIILASKIGKASSVESERIGFDVYFLNFCIGEVQTDLAAELLSLRPCGFRPQHSSKLGNEFRLFTSYDPGARLGGWQHDI